MFYANLPFGFLALIALWRAFPSTRLQAHAKRAGLAIAHYGRYKAFLLVGFAVSTAGFALMATARPDTAYAFLILAMGVLGIGAGLLVGTLNLAAQNAARLHEMGVVSSFTQFSRSMGGTLGSAGAAFS